MVYMLHYLLIFNITPIKYSWRHGVVVSGVRRMNIVNARRARLVSTWMGDRLRAGVPSRYVTSQLGQTQPCIPPGLLDRVPASAGVRAGMSPLPGGR